MFHSQEAENAIINTGLKSKFIEKRYKSLSDDIGSCLIQNLSNEGIYL